MKKAETSKYSLKLGHVNTMTLEQCRGEVEALNQEFMLIDGAFKVSEDLPLLRELIMGRIKEVHGAICVLQSRGKNYEQLKR